MFPVIFISDSIFIPTYFLGISLSFSLSLFWFYYRVQKWALSTEVALNLSLLLMVTGFLGARIFHVFYEAPEYYELYPQRIFYIWQGGFVFYGGFFLSVLSGWLYLKFKKEKVFSWLGVLAPIFCFGYMMGRLTTLFSGSGYGAPTHLPWGIIYPPGTEAPSGIPLHPTPIYSMLWQGLGLFLILYFENYWLKKAQGLEKLKTGILFFFYLFWHGCGRLIIEQFRNDDRGAVLGGLSISSWISLVLMGAALFLGLYQSLRQSKVS